MSLCLTCEHDIIEGDEFSTCDSCEREFHWKCANVRKTDVNARVNSKCLQLYCPECYFNKTCGTYDKLKEISKLMYKLDAYNQNQIAEKQKENDIIASLVQQVKSLEDKLSKLESGDAKPNVYENQQNVIKRNHVKPAVVVMPKTKQQSAKTFADITKNVSESSVNVCGTRQIKDGGVVLRCNTSNETMKVKQLVHEKLGDAYEIVLPKIKLPRVRITNIDTDIQKDEIVNELKKHNTSIINMNISLITVIAKKYRGHSYNDIVIEIDCDSYVQLMKMKKLELPWRECRIFDHLHVIRCYKCCGFSHKSSQCTKTQVCSKCSGEHKFADCTAKQNCCINCKSSNQKYKTKFDTKHGAYSKECQLLKRQLSKLVSKIEYNHSE